MVFLLTRSTLFLSTSYKFKRNVPMFEPQSSPALIIVFNKGLNRSGFSPKPSLSTLPWQDILQEEVKRHPIMCFSSVIVLSLFMCVKMSGEYFTAPCGKGSGCGGWQAAVTPFPLDSFSVPSIATVVQPLSDLCCIHTDTHTHRMNTKISQTFCSCTLLHGCKVKCNTQGSKLAYEWPNLERN